MKTRTTNTPQPEANYRLSRVKDGLWTVEGAYSTTMDPAEYFRPSRLYANVLPVDKPSPRSIIARKTGRIHFLERAKSKLFRRALKRRIER